MCVACESGFTNSAGDPKDGPDTSCDESSCSAISISSLGSGVVPDAANSDACSEGLVLTGVTDQTCDLKCAAGYTGQAKAYTCTSGSLGNEPTCYKNTCNAPNLGKGVVGDSSNSDACAPDTQLNVVDDPTCDLECATGYTGSASTLTCSSAQTFQADGAGGTATGVPTCVEKTCAAYTFDTGVVAGNVDGCVSGAALTAVSDNESTWGGGVGGGSGGGMRRAGCETARPGPPPNPPPTTSTAPPDCQ